MAPLWPYAVQERYYLPDSSSILLPKSYKDSKVLALVANAWAGFGAAFGPVVLMSLIWRKMTMWGALAGMLSGAFTVIFWVSFKADFGNSLSQLYEMIPGVIMASLSIVIVSIWGPQNVSKVGDDFDHVSLFLKEKSLIV